MAAEAGYVLDGSALLAMLIGEPGAERVEVCLHQAVISSVNWGEVATKLLQKGAGPSSVRRMLGGLHLDIVPWTHELVWDSLDLCALAWTRGLSLGDRACLALARAQGRTALTADAAWPAAVERSRPAIAVELIREPRRQG